MRDLNLALEKRRAEQLYRSRRIAAGPQKPERVIDGRRVISFCSNDYLGLANHPVVIKAFKQAADEYGVGSGAAHLINGHTHAHHALEEEIAAFTGRERALLFSTGYMANLGIVWALTGRGDTVFEDRLNHASLLDAGLLSGARMMRYQHADPKALQMRLQSTGDSLGAASPGQSSRQASPRTVLIATDGVFSMDGDIAPIRELANIAVEHDAWLMIDDAHGIGVLGENGCGVLEHLGLDQRDVPILIGTFGKALGTFGAFVAGSEGLIETLIQQARTYIYTTALPPAIAEATHASLKLVRHEAWRRARLRDLVKRFRSGAEQQGLRLMPSETPIQPLMIGDAIPAKAASDALFEQGFMVTAIRPPTVPHGTARLRVTLSALHTNDQVDRFLHALGTQSVLTLRSRA
jgi:8-amino-7-oxononanoate synthase